MSKNRFNLYTEFTLTNHRSMMTTASQNNDKKNLTKMRLKQVNLNSECRKIKKDINIKFKQLTK